MARDIGHLQIGCVGRFRRRRDNSGVTVKTLHQKLRPTACNENIVADKAEVFASANLRDCCEHIHPRVALETDDLSYAQALEVFQRTVRGAVVDQDQLRIELLKVRLSEQMLDTLLCGLQVVIGNYNHREPIRKRVILTNIPVFVMLRKFFAVIAVHTLFVRIDRSPEIKRLAKLTQKRKQLKLRELGTTTIFVCL